MIERFLITLLLCCWLLPLGAQQMWVEDFTRLKRPIWNRSKTTVDKKLALLDLKTGEKGFEFKADGQQPAEAEEGDGVITVKLPNKTRFVTIKHPDYGQQTWRVPVKYLKRKKHYRATLQTIHPEKKYQLQRQWVVFNVSPENAIIKVDSTTTLMRSNKEKGQNALSFYLPLGSHTYQVESPFYEAVKDSFKLTDTAKVEINIKLQPVYSYLTVQTPWEKGKIYVDGQLIGKKEGTSQRLMGGQHRLAVYFGRTCCYDMPFDINKTEKKTITLSQKNLGEYFLAANTRTFSTKNDSIPSVKKAEITGGTQVTLKAPDNDTEILLDREIVGKGQWSGQLPQGYHMAATRKDGMESEPTNLWITDAFPQEVNLSVPQTGCGMFNITSNVTGAKVFIDSVCVGETPFITAFLPTHRSYVVRLEKEGYREAQQTSQPKSNDLLDIYIKLKKNKRQ